MLEIRGHSATCSRAFSRSRTDRIGPRSSLASPNEITATHMEEARPTVARGTNGALVDAVLRPMLRRARTYRRAVAFFSSSVFLAAEKDFTDFFLRGGSMELVCAPVFSATDAQALASGLYERQSDQPVPLFTGSALDRASRWLTWAVRQRRLEVRIAVPRIHSTGLYHEKIGIVTDESGSLIATEGSANESGQAYLRNYERMVVHVARKNERGTAAAAIDEQFERLWLNETEGLRVMSVHEAFREGLIRIRSEDMPEEGPGTKEIRAGTYAEEILRAPARLSLRPYQKLAVDAWFKQGGRGIFSMATGTGKTITAMSVAEALFERAGPPMAIVIVAPYIQLVRQWIGIGRDFGLNPINCSGSRTEWQSAAKAAMFLVHSGARPLLSLVTTNATFALPPFQSLLEELRVRTLLIADEVHNLGARNLQNALPSRIRLRLGLSATPTRWMDEEGTTAINEYFGNVAFSLDLGQAINLDPPVLTPYVYHPVLITLDDDEREEYLEITRQLARYMCSPAMENLSDVALGLLLRRSRLMACARGKLPALEGLMSPFRETRFNLVYCGDGRTEVEEAVSEAARGVPETTVLRQVEAVARVLGLNLGMNVGIYTSDVADQQRVTMLEEFSQGHKQALVAIRCLDEGIDIPAVRRAFILASSTNPRQFIQRRGRILRRAPGKEESEIYDFVVVPPLDCLRSGTREYEVLRNLVSKEMARVVEFARLAVNGPQARAKLLPLLSHLHLLHLS